MKLVQGDYMIFSCKWQLEIWIFLLGTISAFGLIFTSSLVGVSDE
jgi:hypothetical protein